MNRKNLPPQLLDLVTKAPEERTPEHLVVVTDLSNNEPAATLHRAKNYLLGRGYIIQSETPDRVVFQRGSFWGNMTSFDISDLITESILEIKPGQIKFICKVQTFGQLISGWNYIDLMYELTELRSVSIWNLYQHELAALIQKRKGLLRVLDWTPASRFWPKSVR